MKDVAKKVWRFIWDEDSIWSWIVNVILAFVLIKFIVYPGLGFAFQTTHPVVAVVSGSMEHDGNFEAWWESEATCGRIPCSQKVFYGNYNITEDDFKHFSFKNGFNTGDIMVLYGTAPEDIKAGDVIVYASDRPDPIIHRVIKIYPTEKSLSFRTKGDHNWVSYPFEANIGEERYIGRAVLRIPYLGWVKIGFVKLIGLFQ